MTRISEVALTAINLLALELVQSLKEWCAKGKDEPPQPFIYIPTLPLWLFLQRGDEHYQSILDEAIQGRAILIGQNVIGGADSANTPVHGAIPGVVVHAQALDNLMNWGNRQWRLLSSEDRLGPYYSVFVLLYSIFCVAFIDTMSSYSYSKTLQYIILLSISLMIVLVAILGYCLAPVNWLWIITLVVIGDVGRLIWGHFVSENAVEEDTFNKQKSETSHERNSPHILRLNRIVWIFKGRR